MCRKWWRNQFTSAVAVVLIGIFKVLLYLALRASPTAFLQPFIRSIMKECTDFESREKQFNNEVLKDGGNNFDQLAKWLQNGYENNKAILKRFIEVESPTAVDQMVSFRCQFTGFNWMQTKEDR